MKKRITEKDMETLLEGLKPELQEAIKDNIVYIDFLTEGEWQRVSGSAVNTPNDPARQLPTHKKRSVFRFFWKPLDWITEKIYAVYLAKYGYSKRLDTLQAFIWRKSQGY